MAKAKEEKEVTKRIKWLPPYTDDSLDFGPATGDPGNPEKVMYKPGNAAAPTERLRAYGRIVMTLPAIIADNYLTHPTMRFEEVAEEVPDEAEQPLLFDGNVTARPVEPGSAIPNPESVSTDTATEQHTTTNTPTR
jgi:hypothetical protein